MSCEKTEKTAEPRVEADKTGAPKVGQRLLGVHVAKKTASADSDGDLASDLIWGVGGIASYLGLPVGKTYYLISREKIPVKRFGHRTIAASRCELRRLFTSPDTPTA